MKNIGKLAEHMGVEMGGSGRSKRLKKKIQKKLWQVSGWAAAFGKSPSGGSKTGGWEGQTRCQ